MAPTHDHRPRVLIVGPVGGTGGMAAVARQTVDAATLSDWNIRVVDTASGDCPRRSRIRAVLAHASRFARLLRELIAHRPHVVHIHTCSFMTFLRTMPDILVCRGTGVPVVLHIHGGFFEAFLKALGPITGRLVRAHLRMCRRVILLGQTWRARLVPLVPGLCVEVVPNAVDTRVYAGDPTARRGRRILFVGDLAPAKGADDLLQAVAQLSPDQRDGLRVRIVGGGDPKRREQLDQLAHTLDVSSCVELAGPLAPAEVRREYRAADVFVLPSHGEGMPISLLEAMAAGLPSIVSDVGAVREVLQDGREGCLVPAGAPAVLAQRIALLLEDETLRFAMGAAAMLRAQREFDSARFRSRITAIWRDLAVPVSLHPPPIPAKFLT